MNDVTPMITFLKNIVEWVEKYFDLISNFNLKTNEYQAHLFVQNHANFTKFEARKFTSFERGSIQLKLCTIQIVELPLGHFLNISDQT